MSCLALSHNGRYLASGQVTYMGFTADIIIWDLQTRTLLHRMSLHKVKVQSLSFSGDDLYLASLGGQDDSALVVWHVESGQVRDDGRAAPPNAENARRVANPRQPPLAGPVFLGGNQWRLDGASGTQRPCLGG